MKKAQENFLDSNQSNRMEGISSISALLHGMELGINDRKILRVYFDRAKLHNKLGQLRFLKAKSAEYGFEIEMVDSDTIDALAVGRTHGGIVADCTDRTIPIFSEEVLSDDGAYFILDGIEDPYNFGDILRSLYASGVSGVILGRRNWMDVAGMVARASAGASEKMRLFVSDPTEAIAILKRKQYTVYCAGIRDSISLSEASLSKPLAMILGGEKRGISRALLDQADVTVRIDYGTDFGGSLSSSASAAVLAFEILSKNR